MDARRTLREMKLLRQLKHPNIISLVDLPSPADVRSFHDVYLVYELMDTNLHRIVRSKQPLSDEHNQFFIYQARPLPTCGNQHQCAGGPPPRWSCGTRCRRIGGMAAMSDGASIVLGERQIWRAREFCIFRRG